MTRDHAKKVLLSTLSTILLKDDDLFPDVDDSSPDYDKWHNARNELIAEFDRRAAQSPKTLQEKVKRRDP